MPTTGPSKQVYNLLVVYSFHSQYLLTLNKSFLHQDEKWVDLCSLFIKLDATSSVQNFAHLKVQDKQILAKLWCSHCFLLVLTKQKVLLRLVLTKHSLCEFWVSSHILEQFSSIGAMHSIHCSRAGIMNSLIKTVY